MRNDARWNDKRRREPPLRRRRRAVAARRRRRTSFWRLSFRRRGDARARVAASLVDGSRVAGAVAVATVAATASTRRGTPTRTDLEPRGDSKHGDGDGDGERNRNSRVARVAAARAEWNRN